MNNSHNDPEEKMVELEESCVADEVLTLGVLSMVPSSLRAKDPKTG
jgi:hypothetical protein